MTLQCRLVTNSGTLTRVTWRMDGEVQCDVMMMMIMIMIMMMMVMQVLSELPLCPHPTLCDVDPSKLVMEPSAN